MNLQKMMQQAQQMQEKMAQIQAKIEAMEIDGAAGGGMVKVRLNGKSHLLKADIDPSLLKPEEKEVLEDLLIAAYNDARAKAESTFSAEMSALTGGMNLPPGLKLPF